MRWQRVDLQTSPAHAPGAQGQEARYQVDDRSLARPVRSDEPGDAPLSHREVDPADRLEATESLGDSAEFKRHGAWPRTRGQPRRPPSRVAHGARGPSG